MLCYKCGKEIDDNATFCPYCGCQQDNTEKKYCSRCNYENKYDAKFCERCGSSLEQKGYLINGQAKTNSNISNKSRASAAILAFFFGSFGIHNFYLKNTGFAIAQLILTLTVILSPISIIWSLIDFIMILCGQLKDGNDKEVKNWSGIENE